jgi:hypothetical protein
MVFLYLLKVLDVKNVMYKMKSVHNVILSSHSDVDVSWLDFWSYSVMPA